jgi:cytochrome c-type biogenesis protein CcmE
MSENEDNDIENSSEDTTESAEDISDSSDDIKTENIEPKKRKRSGLSSMRVKLVVVFLIIAIALTIGLWGGAPEDYKTLEEVMRDTDSYMGKEIQMVGTVGNWTGGQNFTLMDRGNNTIEIFVLHEKEIPDGFAESKDVVVTGKLEKDDEGFFFKSNKQIQVGCPSKY